MTYQYPATIEIRQYKKPNVVIHHPILTELQHKPAEKKCNQMIVNTIEAMMKAQVKGQLSNKFEMTGKFEIKTNQRGILSVQFTNHSKSLHEPTGFTIVKSLTMNIRTGRQYSLAELFLPDSNYLFTLSRLIQQQMKLREIPLLKPFTSISPNQDFYLADKTLVIYFQLSELTPIDLGIPMFPIHLHEISRLVIPDGPIGIMNAFIT